MLKPDRFSCSQKIWLKRDPPVDIDKTVKPVIHAPRKYALSLIPKIEKELDNMLENGILDWVNEPTGLGQLHGCQGKT